jgi:hypothetical protein
MIGTGCGRAARDVGFARRAGLVIHRISSSAISECRVLYEYWVANTSQRIPHEQCDAPGMNRDAVCASACASRVRPRCTVDDRPTFTWPSRG